MTSHPILPPAMIGVLGGGQLGRYFVMAARTMGYRTTVLEPDPSAPAGAAADVHLAAPYDDADALATLARTCAVVTTEFENPPAAALHTLAASTLVRPAPGAIEITQDRRLEKAFLRDAGIPLAPFVVIDSEDDLDSSMADRGIVGAAILKTARLGYDGKGQITVADAADRDEIARAWHSLGGVACVLEQRLALDREVSVVLARGADGRCAVHPTAQNVHVGGILDLTVVPADPIVDGSDGTGSSGGANRAAELAVRIAEALDYVGVLAVEMFVVGGELLVNELAPRPHNSGHWTLDAAATSQFEQQVRAVCGLPLGDPSLIGGGAAMVNLLGDEWSGGPPDWAAALTDPGAHLHLYGKADPRPGRKMGHLTVLGPTAATAGDRALALRLHGRRGLQLDH